MNTYQAGKRRNQYHGWKEITKKIVYAKSFGGWPKNRIYVFLW